MFEPGGESFFQTIDKGLDKFSQVLDLFESDLAGFETLNLCFSGRQGLFSRLITYVDLS